LEQVAQQVTVVPIQHFLQLHLPVAVEVEMAHQMVVQAVVQVEALEVLVALQAVVLVLLIKDIKVEIQLILQ
jgi:hypothetical protein